MHIAGVLDNILLPTAHFTQHFYLGNLDHLMVSVTSCYITHLLPSLPYITIPPVNPHYNFLLQSLSFPFTQLANS